MDKGTQSSTSLRNIAKTLNKVYDHDENLEDLRIGSIHSHNSMDVYFSSTDINDLFQDVDIYNPFISLITNNEDHYVAKLSFLVSTDIADYHTGEKLANSKQIYYYNLNVKVKRNLYDLNTMIQDMIDNGIDLNELYDYGDLTETFEKEVDDAFFLRQLNKINKPKPQSVPNWPNFKVHDDYCLDYSNKEYKESLQTVDFKLNMVEEAARDVGDLVNYKSDGQTLLEHIGSLNSKDIKWLTFEAGIRSICTKYTYEVIMTVFENICDIDIEIHELTETQQKFIDTFYNTIENSYADYDKI